MAADRDGPSDGSYGPTRAWWKTNGFYLMLGTTVYSTALAGPTSQHVILRNLLICLLWYGGMHYALFVRRILPHREKLNPEW